MESWGKRLKSLRLSKTIKLSQNDLARAANVSPEYVGKIERGEVTNVGTEVVDALAKALAVAPSFLLYGVSSETRPENAFDAPEYEPYDLPVVGLARAGKEGFFDDQGFPVGEGFRKIHRPYTVKDPNAYAVQIDGDSMSPRVYKGDIVIVTPSHEVKNGDLAIARLNTGEVMLKEVRFQEPLVILTSVNPSHDPIAVKKKDLDFLHRVVMIKTK